MFLHTSRICLVFYCASLMNTNILPQATINRYIVARHKTTYHYLLTSIRYFAVPPLISNLISLHLTHIGASFSHVTPKVNGYPSTALLVECCWHHSPLDAPSMFCRPHDVLIIGLSVPIHLLLAFQFLPTSTTFDTFSLLLRILFILSTYPHILIPT